MNVQIINPDINTLNSITPLAMNNPVIEIGTINQHNINPFIPLVRENNNLNKIL